MNEPLIQAISNFTSWIRFPGEPNTDLRTFSANVIPFPRLHFYVPSQYSNNSPNPKGADYNPNLLLK